MLCCRKTQSWCNQILCNSTQFIHYLSIFYLTFSCNVPVNHRSDISVSWFHPSVDCFLTGVVYTKGQPFDPRHPGTRPPSPSRRRTWRQQNQRGACAYCWLGVREATSLPRLRTDDGSTDVRAGESSPRLAVNVTNLGTFHIHQQKYSGIWY